MQLTLKVIYFPYHKTAFSWAILAFEWSNAFTVFKSTNGKFPLSTFQKLFLPDAELTAKGFLDSANPIAPDIVRAVLGSDDKHYLSTTLDAMNIQISCDVKAAMDAAVTSCNCAENPSCGACGFHGMFTDLCGEGYINCVAR